jgi:hypothetical protein
MLPSEVEVAIDLFKHSSDTVNTLWNFFSAGVGVAIALVFAGKESLPSRGKAIVAIAFIGFSITNAWALEKAQGTARAAARVINEFSATTAGQSYRPVLSTIRASQPTRVVWYQRGLSLALLIAIFLMHRYETRTQSASSSGVSSLR